MLPSRDSTQRPTESRPTGLTILPIVPTRRFLSARSGQMRDVHRMPPKPAGAPRPRPPQPAAPSPRLEARSPASGLPVFLGVEGADLVAFVADEALDPGPLDDRLDHARIAAQEDVEVVGCEREARLDLDRVRGDEVLEVAAAAAPLPLTTSDAAILKPQKAEAFFLR